MTQGISQKHFTLEINSIVC